MIRKFHVTQYAAIFNKKCLLLLKDSDRIKGTWCFPGGHVDLETDPIKALGRELNEELGVKLIKAALFNTAIKKYPSGKWKYVVYYKCLVKGSIKLSHEHSEYKWICLKDLKSMTFRDAHERQLIITLLKDG